MRINALSNARFTKFGSNERIVGQNGEINAGSQAEMASRLLQLIDLVSKKEVANDVEVASAEEAEKTLREAFLNKDLTAWGELASDLVADISTRQERSGFMRNFLARGVAPQGSPPRMRIRQKNVTAIMVKGPAMIYPQLVREGYVYLDEVAIASRPRITTKDINQGAPGLLDEKYYEALEATYVQEDRMFIKAARRTIGIHNDAVTFTGDLTPAIVRQLEADVSENRLPVAALLMADDLIKDFITPAFIQVLQFTPHHAELVANGRIGSIFGTEIVTDATREENLRVLDKGESFSFTEASSLGAYTDRGPIQSKPVEEFENNTMTRGWDVWEDISMGIANAKGVGYAKRV